MMYFLQYRDSLKYINHGRKIVRLQEPEEQWFHDDMQLSRMRDLCMSGYTTINHGMLSTFVHSQKSIFHLPHGEMAITLDDMSYIATSFKQGKTIIQL